MHAFGRLVEQHLTRLKVHLLRRQVLRGRLWGWGGVEGENEDGGDGDDTNLFQKTNYQNLLNFTEKNLTNGSHHTK